MEGNKNGWFFHLASNLVIFITTIVVIGLTAQIVSAAPVTPTRLYTTATSTSAITIAWATSTTDTSTYYDVAYSTDGVTWSTTTIATSTPAGAGTGNNASSTFTSLSVDTRYYFQVAAGSGTATSTVIALSVFTLANTATVTVDTPTSTAALPITININGNSTTTTYAIYNYTSSTYLTSAGAESASAVYYTTSTWNTAGGAAQGLLANEAYQFTITPKNGSGSTAATSTASTAVSTLASAPASVTASATYFDATISWTASNATNYYVENTTASTNSGNITTASYTFYTLNCGTAYSFRVKSLNTDGVASAWSTINKTTESCTGGGGDVTPATSATPATPATPAVPGVTPAVPATPATPATPASVTVSNTPGSIIKVNAKDRPAVYYLLDGKKYLFVNRVTYTTWSKDAGDMANNFSTLKLVTQAEFDAIQLGGNLVAKPGTLIKFDNGPDTYGVATGGKLFQLADYAAQVALYGDVTPVVIQSGFRTSYYDNGNAIGILPANSSKPK